MDIVRRHKSRLNAVPAFFITLLTVLTLMMPRVTAAETASPLAEHVTQAHPNPLSAAPVGQPGANPSPAPMTIKLDPVGSLKITNDEPGFATKYIVPFVGPLISGLLAFGGIWLSFKYNRYNNEQTIWQKANESELKELTAKLDGFYGPFLQMSKANHLISEEFRARQETGFRTLVAVFNRDWLAGLPTGDRRVVQQVCETAALLEKFITENAGMVDGQVLPYLARASAHFRILNLAYQGELGTDATNFEKYAYPKHLDAVLDLEIKRIQDRCDALRKDPAKPIGAMPQLEIPATLSLEEWPSTDRHRPQLSRTISP